MELPENVKTVSTTKYELDDNQSKHPIKFFSGIRLQPNSSSLSVFSICIFLATFSAISSVFESLDNLRAVAMVVAIYVLLVLLLLCVHLLDGLPETSPKRQPLKVLVWLLSTVLNFIFAWRFSPTLPFPFAAFGWCLAGVTGVLGFYFLIVYRNQELEDDEVEYYYDCEKLGYSSVVPSKA